MNEKPASHLCTHSTRHCVHRDVIPVAGVSVIGGDVKTRP